MFQDFTAAADPAQGTANLARLREQLAVLGIDALFVPRSDEHMGEYVSASAERLKWLTGFTGSAGLAVVTAKRAALFVDGRYVLQAGTQVDTASFEIVQVPENDPGQWLAQQLRNGDVAGFDPWLHTSSWVERTSEALARKAIKLKPLGRNPIDRAWGRGRPAAPTGAVREHPLKYAGQPAAEKLASLQQTLKGAGEDAAILTLPDSIAWAFNIRGDDIKHTPTPLAFAILHASGKPELFLDKRKLGGGVKSHLASLARLREPDELKARIDALKKAGKRVRVDAGSAAYWFRLQLGNSKKLIADGSDPCILPKAKKNAAEINGTRAAHERDGVAMARFLAWLDAKAPSGKVDEIEAVTRLEGFRADTQALKEISFDTISGAVAAGA